MEIAAAVAHRPATPVGHDIPSLDGLRTVAIAIVVLSHTRTLLPPVIANSGIFRYVIGGGLHGVQVFFVISGYLITTLLLREFERTGEMSLRRFYARRVLRIFPAFYIYLAAVALLWGIGVQKQDTSTFVSAATYTIIYHPRPQGWFVQHAWSLSIEEQFYLLWPAVLLLAHRRRVAARVAIVLLALMPIVRMLVLSFSEQRAADHNRVIVNSSAIDMLMVGCLLALLSSNIRWRRWCKRWISSWSAAGLLVLGMVLVPYADAKLVDGPLARLCVALGFSVTAISIGAAIEYLVRTPSSVPGRILNVGAMRHLGTISYSIYLWQQLFSEEPIHFGVLTYGLILIAAELTFWLVERPVMRIRARLAV